MRRFGYFLVVAAILLLTVGLATAKHNKLPEDFILEPVLTGLDRPSAMAMAPNGRVYIAERFTGKVLLVRHGKLLPGPVVTVSVDTGTDEGLLGIAHDPGGPDNGYLYLFYTESGSGDNKVVRYTVKGNKATDPFTVINLGPSTGDVRIGGGLAVGNDGKLYIGVGDMESSSDAQVNTSNLGKVLRLNPDGSVPIDNPDWPNAFFAKGFRDGAGLAAHPDVATVYMTDRGPVGGYDELNAVVSGDNYAWPDYNGEVGIGGYTDPLESHSPLVGTHGLAVYTGIHFPDASADGEDNDLDGSTDERDETYADSVFYACYDTNDIVRSSLIGVGLDAQSNAQKFFDPTMEWDGTPDTQCPPALVGLAEGADEMLYVLSDDEVGTKDGLYRVVYNRPGPREVSPPGSLFPLTVEKNGPNLDLYWENVGRDAWIGSVRGASQPAEAYTIWEGSLPITAGGYSHTVKTTTNGTAVNEGLLSAQITPAAGNTYQLISHQGSNLEGTLGLNSLAAERTGKPIQDYCDEIGWFDNEYGDSSKETQCDGIDNDGDGSIDESCPGRCGRDFVDGNGQPARLLDQYGNYKTLWDFRGDVLHMDISALDCTYCKRQAPAYRDFEDEYKGRGFNSITVLANDFGTMSPIAPANCAAELQNWIDTYAPGAEDHILCGADDDGDGVIDIYEQYGEHLYLYIIFWQRCSGTPQNLFFNQGMRMYEAVCGKWYGRCIGSGSCDGDAAACSNDHDCVGHGGTETCTGGVNCTGDVDCLGEPVETCEHWRDRQAIEDLLPVERCE